MLDYSCQSSHPGKGHGLKFLECDIIEEACQSLEKGISVIKLLIPQGTFRMADKPEMAETEFWRIRWMRKCCHFHASNFDRSFLGIAKGTIVHVNRDVLHDSLTAALIAPGVKALDNCINKVLLVMLLSSRRPFRGTLVLSPSPRRDASSATSRHA
jgi:hypothetical protein